MANIGSGEIQVGLSVNICMYVYTYICMCVRRYMYICVYVYVFYILFVTDVTDGYRKRDTEDNYVTDGYRKRDTEDSEICAFSINLCFILYYIY